MLITILTGSHFSNKKHNQDQSEAINELLYKKANPLFDFFNTEVIWLDEVDSFLSFVISSSVTITNKQNEDFLAYLKKFIKFDGSSFIFVGEFYNKV